MNTNLSDLTKIVKVLEPKLKRVELTTNLVKYIKDNAFDEYEARDFLIDFYGPECSRDCAHCKERCYKPTVAKAIFNLDTSEKLAIFSPQALEEYDY